MSKEVIYKILASLIDARITCIEKGNLEEIENHENSIERIMKENAPSGAGFDSGTGLLYKESTGEKLVFNTSFHHMNEVGFYDGWTEHTVICTSSLAFDFNLRITGRDRNDIKEYIAETFEYFLHTQIERN